MSLKLTTTMTKGRKFGQKREALRNTYWPGSAGRIWSRKTHDGFTSIPRSLPLFMRLIRELCPKGKGNPANVYLDLWSRVYDEGFVKITDDESFAYAAGYSGSRAVRTWREHLQNLVDLGFINTKQLGNRDVAAVLIVNPYKVVTDLHTGGKVPEEWWTFFVAHCQEIGAAIPEQASEASAG